MIQQDIQECIALLKLPLHFAETVERWYLPIIDHIASWSHESDKTLVLGIQGTQGSGKSTMAAFMSLLLEKQFNLNVAQLSLDDFYLTLQEREALSQQVHPLLRTRGVPGTHDVRLAIDTIQQLQALDEHQSFMLPRFNKAMDDRENRDKWPLVKGPIDLVIFEGWCVGAAPMKPSSLKEDENNLELLEDPHGIWRHFVNEQLEYTYPPLFSLLDKLVVISTDSFDNVYHWRLLQEQKLARAWIEENTDRANKIIDTQSLKRFIAHYERVTKHCLATLPEKADWVLQIDKNHTFISLRLNETVTS